MTTELLGNICLTLILIWGIYLVYQVYKFNKITFKDRDNINIQSKPLHKHKDLIRQLRWKLFISFLIVALLLIVIFASYNLSKLP